MRRPPGPPSSGSSSSSGSEEGKGKKEKKGRGSCDKQSSSSTSSSSDSDDASEFDDSGAYPLSDKVLGYKLLEAARGTKFSFDFQAAQETSQRLGYQPRGRLLLWMVFQCYRLEKDRGAALTQHHLLSLTVAGNDVKGLEDFKQKFNYVWEALDVNERPTDNGVRSLLFEQLKNHPKMALHIDKYRNSSSSSSKRTWKWLLSEDARSHRDFPS